MEELRVGDVFQGLDLLHAVLLEPGAIELASHDVDTKEVFFFVYLNSLGVQPLGEFCETMGEYTGRNSDGRPNTNSSTVVPSTSSLATPTSAHSSDSWMFVEAITSPALYVIFQIREVRCLDCVIICICQ